MSKHHCIFLSLILLFLAQLSVYSQKTEWMRVVSDNGEFSVEVPAEYGFFADKEGFSVADSLRSYELTDMVMFNAFFEKTLISFESYKGDKAALNALRLTNADGGKTSEIKIDNYIIKQIVSKSDQSYSVIKYLKSDEFIYVLTAAARTGETPAMKRFFDSLVFKLGAKNPETTPKTVAFSELKATPIEFGSVPLNLSSIDIKPIAPVPSKTDDIKAMILISKPRATYTDTARKNKIAGTIVLRTTFSKEARISKVLALESFSSELLRQAIFAAIRIKFLPPEKNGETLSVSRPVQFQFSIY